MAGSRRIEEVLAADPEVRRRLQAMERTWELLDELEEAPAGEAPNLHLAEKIVIDPATKTKVVNREITVSTNLRPELYLGKADQPVRK